MKDWKTTVTGLVGVVAVFAARYGLELGPDVQVSIVTLTLFFIGLFAKDAKGNQPS